MKQLVLTLLLLMVAIQSWAIAADEPQPVVRRFRPTLEDVRAVTGLDIYTWRAKMNAGDRFRLVLVEFDTRDAKPRELADESFTVQKDADVKILVSFLRTDRRMAGVLLSNENNAEFGLRCYPCDSYKIIKTIPVPLSKIPTTDKILYFPNKAFPREKSTITGVPLLRVERKNKERGNGYPRAEVVLQMIK